MIPVAVRGITRRDALRLGLGAPIAWGLGAFAPLARGDEEAGRPGSRIFVYGELIVGAERLKGTFAIDPEAGTWVRIAEGSPTGRVSPDGRTLAYLKFDRSAEKEAGIWLVETNGEGVPRHISDLVGVPIWSHDGKHLVISVGNADRTRFETWKIRVDGSEPTRLPLPDDALIVHDGSPDGAWLLVSTGPLRGPGGVRRPASVIHPDGNGKRVVTAGGELIRGLHRFAAGGRKVVYYQVETNDDCGLWIVDLDGTNRRPFAVEKDDRAPFGAAWSPDGRRAAILYFDRSRDEQGRRNKAVRDCTIEVVDADGKDARPVSLPMARTLRLLDWR